MTAPAATGFVVAGGRSRRMGRDKALLPWGRTTLLDHALDRLRQCCAAVRILGGPAPRYEDRGVPVDLDAVADAGPIGGLLSGLVRLHPAGLGLFLAVDLPNVPVALLARLLTLAEGYDAVVPVCAGGPQPLCGVYRATCRDAVRRQIEALDHKLTAFWPAVRVREVSEEEVARFGDPGGLFHNVNTLKDLTWPGP